MSADATPLLDSLYQELILDHHKRPRNRGELPDASADVEMYNPVCGDDVRLQLRLEDGVVRAARFQGQGCSISQASASMMTHVITGMRVEDATRVADTFTRMMHGDAAAARDRALGDLRSLAGVSRYPARVKCALLAWNALSEALGHAAPQPDTREDE